MSGQFAQLFDILPFNNVDLLSVGVAIAAIGILGFVIFVNDIRNVTNQSFFIFSLVTIFWSFFNYISYQSASPVLILWLFRIVVFLGVWHSFTFFNFCYVFPDSKKKFPKLYDFLLLPFVILVSFFTLSPFVFSGISQVSATGSVSTAVVAKGIVVFILTVIGLLIAGVVIFIKKTRHAKGDEKKPYHLILAGTLTTFALLFTFNLILPAVFSEVRFIPLGALFILPFVAFTSYAIYKHHLFNIKVAAIAFVAFILSVFSFINILYAASASQIVVNVTLFVAVLLGSVILIKSVLREIEQRERIQLLADDLTKANENQVALIHFITHQVKGFFTKSRNIFSLLTEGEAGALTPEMQRYVNEGFDSDTKGVAMVQDVLNAANIKSGIVKYAMAPFDLCTLVSALVVEYKKMAEDKHIELAYTCWGAVDGKNSDATMSLTAVPGKKPSSYLINGDMEQLRQVFKNLIENSIKYTPKGSVSVRLSQSVAESAADHTQKPKIVFSVKDTGVGITDEDKKLLFTQGGHGKDSVKINVESTGYGLYIAKGIVEAHHGRIWAESAGKDKGSAFYVELPAA